MIKQNTVEQAGTNPTFSDYWNAGIPVIPESSGMPLNGLRWGRIYTANWKPSDEELLEWDLTSAAGMGLVTGTPSNIIAIDLDEVTEAEIAQAVLLLGDTPCKKFGSKGLTLFYAYNNEKNYIWKKPLSDGSGKYKICAELLSTGSKTTIPPSRHRKAAVHYKWVGVPIIGAALPRLPENYVERLDSLFKIIRKITPAKPSYNYDVEPDFDEAVRALFYCNANCDNEEWVNIGMAFKSITGDAGFNEFDKWSAGGSTYDKASIRSRWRSFESHSIGAGTLFYYAKQGGYEITKLPPMQPVISMNVEEWSIKKLEHYAQEVKAANELPDFYTQAPHHIKTICDWIVNSARYPQPLITLGAVLSTLGFLMGRSFRYKGIRGNIYNINLARTGHGKEHIISCVRGLANYAKSPQSAMWTSDSAIMEKLNETAGSCFYIIDEMHSVMRSLSNKSSASREGAATSTLLRAYTSRRLEGLDYANRKERATIVIENPFVSIAGFSTPEPFFDAVGSAEAFNGFVGRLTVFEGAKVLPERNKNHNPEADLNIPHDILQMVDLINTNKSRIQHPDGSFSYADTTEVSATPEAEALLEQMNDEIDEKRRHFDKEDSQMSNVIARIFEMMKKYALIASRGKCIEVEHIKWAKAVADYNVGIMLTASANISDTRFDRMKNKFIEFLIKNGGMATRTHVTNYCKIFEGRKEREDCIRDLIDAGRIEQVSLDAGKRQAVGFKLVKKVI